VSSSIIARPPGVGAECRELAPADEIMSFAAPASQLVTRIGFKPTLIAGLLLIAAGLLWFSRVRAPGGSYAADVLGPSLLAAVGLGLAFVP
jgi:fucose permease